MRLIDADALEKRCFKMYGYGDAKFLALGNIRTAPTIEAKTVVHGRWIKLDVHKGIEQFKCSICRSECYVPTCMGEPMYAFCPNCGNPMDGEENDPTKERLLRSCEQIIKAYEDGGAENETE